MKTIKFFSLAMLLSLAWVACKDANSTSQEDTAATLSAEVLTTNKTSAAENINNLKVVVDRKVQDLEVSLSAAADASKADLTAQLDKFKAFQSELSAMAAKVEGATIETWSTIANEVEALHGNVKSALVEAAGGEVGGGAGGQLTN